VAGTAYLFMLVGTNKTVSEIAYEVGFQYPHHLSRMFKKVVGCTPKEYRHRRGLMG